MTIEATLSEVLSTLKAIHTALASGAAVAATAPTAATAEPAAPAAEKPVRKPREVSTSPAATETKPAATQSAAQPAATKAADWKADVMPVLLEINKSTKPGHGRDGLVGLITKFLGDATKKIPDLEKLGKHDEVLAAAKALLTGEPATAGEPDDEFGLGI